jgi:hypothetical protein
MLQQNWPLGYLDEISDSLDLLNHSGGINAQLDQLLASFGTFSDSNLPPPMSTDTKDLFRIPKINDIPIEGMHSAAPPTRNTWTKLTETKWQELAGFLQARSVSRDYIHLLTRILSSYLISAYSIAMPISTLPARTNIFPSSIYPH